MNENESTKTAKTNDGGAVSVDAHVIFKFSAIRKRDNQRVYGTYPFKYIEGVEAYNMSAFWRYINTGYLDENTIIQEI